LMLSTMKLPISGEPPSFSGYTGSDRAADYILV
jgi:hypothetical protein